MRCPKDVSKSSGKVKDSFEPVTREVGQKIKTNQSPRTSNFGIKQTSTSRWAQVYEEIGTGRQSVDLKNVFKALSKLDDSDYENIKIGQPTARLDNISYFVYGTSYLWWAIRIANFNQFATPFSTITAGTDLKVIRKESLFAALKEASEG